MQSKRQRTVKIMLTAAGLGAVAGLRSMTAPAVLALGVNQHWVKRHGPARLMRGGRALQVTSAMAVGEMMVDASPLAPDRRGIPSLVWRMASGVAAGAAICSARRRPIALGALLGAAGAVAGTYGGSLMRRKLSERLASLPAALVEDGIAVGTGTLLARIA